MRIYLDNCCFNRPFDDQSQLIVYLETQAVIAIQEKIRVNELYLIWSYINSYENSQNPSNYVKNEIARWVKYATNPIIQQSPELLIESKKYIQRGLTLYDALHFACSVIGKCDYFLSTDKKMLKKLRDNRTVKAINPIEFAEEMGL